MVQSRTDPAGGIPTAGGSSVGVNTVTLGGSNFGPSCTSCATATYGGASGTEYGPVTCDVILSHSSVRCPTVAGVGAGHRWKVTVLAQSSALSSVSSSYTVPAITGLSGAAFDAPGDTRGGIAITLTGTSFGPAGHDKGLTVVYGPDSDRSKYTAAACSVVSQTRIDCQTAPGVGTALKFTATVAEQSSGTPGYSDSIDYAAPTLTGLSGAAVSSPSPTTGGSQIVIAGDNYGPVGDSATIAASYGPSGDRTKYTAASCTVISHTQINCNTAPGVGSGLQWRVSVAGQTTSSFSGEDTAYQAPTISGLSGAAVSSPSSTTGGSQIVIAGDNYGPVGDLSLIHI